MGTGDKKVILHVEKLGKRYGAFTAVDNISFDIYQGEVLGLLGPNGAGKSTTIDLITTLQQPSNGQITYPGFASSNNPQVVRRHIGIVPQELAIYGNLTVLDNLLYTGKMYGLSGGQLQSRVEALLKEFDLAEKDDARARTLSGGQKRRLNFALADIHAPDLVVLDEPTVGLDPNARSLVWEIIQSFQEAGKTVLLTTHYMEEAEILCDRIILIDKGRIIAVGTPSELKAGLSGEVVLSYKVAGLVSRRQLEDLRLQTGVKQASTDGNSLRVVALRENAEAITKWLSETGLAISGLVAEDITLEDVFMLLTGRHLRGGENGIEE